MIGRLFRYRLLEQLSRQARNLDQYLNEFEEKELVYEERTVPELEYAFKHAFTQEATYQGILEKRRREFHLQVAREMERLYGDRLEECYEELAHHYSSSDDVEKAVEYLLKAGEKAVQTCAYENAIAGFRKGIELVGALADKEGRAQWEARLQTALGWALITNKGFGSFEGGQALSRARELCEQMGQIQALCYALAGLDLFYMSRTDYAKEREAGERCLELAKKQGDPDLIMWAHYRVGVGLACRGEAARALAQYKQGLSLYDPQRDRPVMFMTHAELGVMIQAATGWSLWLLGYPDRALVTVREAVTRAHELSHPLGLANVLWFEGIIHHLNRDLYAAGRSLDAFGRLAAEVGLPTYWIWSTMLLGWNQVQAGEVEEGIGLISKGLAHCRAQGLETIRSYFDALLADAYRISGHVGKGLELLADAIETVERTGEGLFEPELHRIRGDTLLVRGGAEDLAEASFRKAVDIARRQQAKSWELRAATSLSRLLKKQGKREEARRMMSEIYHWFTEGFDTADLKDARSLLDSLA